jgi:hypothetical protein
VLRKRDNNLGIGNKGTVDFNIVLVGDSVIAESRTAKGKQNLSIMMGHVFNHYNVENSNSVNVRIGKITAYEWTCALGGDTFSSTDYEDTGELFKTGSALLSSSSETKAVNLFFVSDIPYSGSGSILGISGAIRGAMINGTTTSGLAVATLGDLANYNPSCTGAGSCPLSSQDADFIDMGSTISHEMGHFLGLNHASESEGTTHDRLPDTPVCTSTSSGSINHDECRTLDTNTLQTTSNKCSVVCLGYNVSSNTFCATAQECQFNHTMWWTTKNYGSSGEGDGNLFSTASGQIINYSPFVR